MRALVVDDQPEFVESIRPILTQSGFISHYASDLAYARKEITQRTFDLVLTDLQMEPGNWGGLEVIKMIREVDPVVPLFVVSGQGSLAECVQAIRLGADDYIRKELFATELAATIDPLFSKPYAIESYPSLIAYLFRLFEDEQQEYAKARKLIDVYENMMRLLSLMLIGEQSAKIGVPSLSLLEQLKMKLPFLGHYVSFVFEALRGGWDGKLLVALQQSDLPKMRDHCDRLTKCRNEEFGHSTAISAHRSVELVEAFSKVLIQVLNAASCLRRFRLFVASTLKYDGVVFTASGRSLCGSNLQHPPATVLLKTAVPTKHTVVIVDGEMIADMAPLVEVVPLQGDFTAYRIYNKSGRNGVEFEMIPR